MISKILSFYSAIPRQEWRKVAVCFLFLFVTMLAYYIAKPVREGLTLEVGSSSLPYLHLFNIVAVAIVGFGYDLLVRKLSRQRLGTLLFTLFIFIFLLFGVAFRATRPADVSLVMQDSMMVMESLFPQVPVTLPPSQRTELSSLRGQLIIAYFLWVSVFILFAMALFWAFVNEIFQTENAKKLFGLIGAGGPAGAMCGSFLTGWFVQSIGVGNLLYLTAIFLLVALGCLLLADRTDQAIRHENQGSQTTPEPSATDASQSGLKLIFSHRFLLLLGAMVICYTLSMNINQYLYAQQVEASLPDTEARTALYAVNYQWINIGGIVIQVLFTGWLLTRLGVIVGLLLPPVCDLFVVGGFFMGAPLSWTTFWLIASFACTYSVYNAAREVLYTAAPRSFKYQGKGLIDTLLFRMGDAAGSVILILVLPSIGLGILLLGVVFPAILCRMMASTFLSRRFTNGRIVD